MHPVGHIYNRMNQNAFRIHILPDWVLVLDNLAKLDMVVAYLVWVVDMFVLDNVDDSNYNLIWLQLLGPRTCCGTLPVNQVFYVWRRQTADLTAYVLGIDYRSYNSSVNHYKMLPNSELYYLELYHQLLTFQCLSLVATSA